MDSTATVQTEILSTDECGVSTGVDTTVAPLLPGPHKRFHFLMLGISLALFLLAVLGSWRMEIWDFSSLWAAVFLVPVSFLPALFWQDRKRHTKRDAALTLPWFVTLTLLMTLVVPLAGRMGFPFRDSLLVSLDNTLGFNAPATVLWISQHHAMKILSDSIYILLLVFLLVAAIIPAVTGRCKAAEEFLLANSFSFLIALPVFILMPAIGPWAGYHFAGSADQRLCEASIRALHGSMNAAVTAKAGIVTCPSFHVIWAVLSAIALSSFRGARFIVWPLAALFVVSTMTTGWHYGTDVLCGLAVATVSILVTRTIVRR